MEHGRKTKYISAQAIIASIENKKDIVELYLLSHLDSLEYSEAERLF